MENDGLNELMKMMRKVTGFNKASREEDAIDFTPEQVDAGKVIDLMSDGDAESVLAFTMSLKAHEHKSLLYGLIPDMPLQQVCMHEDYYHYVPSDVSQLHEVDLSRFPEYAVLRQEQGEMRAMRGVLLLAINALEKRHEILDGKLEAIEKFTLPADHEMAAWKSKTGKLYSLPTNQDA